MGASEEEEAFLLQDEAWIDSSIKVDYGTNLRYVPQPSSPTPKLTFVG